jgi:hypothetical protein
VNLRGKKFTRGDAILGLLGEVRKDSLMWRPRPAISLSALVSAIKGFSDEHEIPYKRLRTSAYFLKFVKEAAIFCLRAYKNFCDRFG